MAKPMPLREQVARLTAARDAAIVDAERLATEVTRLRRENSALQSKYDSSKNAEKRHEILEAEFRMQRSELERVWGFLRKERGIEVPDHAFSCPF